MPQKALRRGLSGQSLGAVDQDRDAVLGILRPPDREVDLEARLPDPLDDHEPSFAQGRSELGHDAGRTGRHVLLAVPESREIHLPGRPACSRGASSHDQLIMWVERGRGCARRP
jgi:hypothetical protein